MSKLFNEPFFVGVNYWASHAGMNMWHDWDENVVIEDLKRLRDAHITVLRMFPLWSDFQPLKAMYTAGGRLMEFRLGEEPLPDTVEGHAGIDPVMVERFVRFCELAEEYGLRLVVGLLTGWMSGRLFVPPALEGRNVLTDPLAITWELKYAKYMVTRFKACPAIAGWDLGNECNCMGIVEKPEQAELWTAAISDAIRVSDPEGTSSGLRPIVSGMHGISPNSCWRPDAHGTLVDILTTHPYPIFTPYCDTDELGSFKSTMHAVGETVWYRGMSKKPAFAEEAGTLGPMLCDEATAAGYVNAVLYQLWAHDCRGFCWWCAAEQSHLTHAPYDWHSVERELGLFRLDGTPKPVALTMKRFVDDTEKMPLLPKRIVDAVCVTTNSEDTWAAAYGAFICAKLAGLDIEYADGSYPLPDAPAYILPSLAGQSSLTRHAWYALFDKVRAGATLLMTLDTALLSPFSEITGLQVHTRSRSKGSIKAQFVKGGTRVTLPAPISLKVVPTTAEVLACETDLNPIMTVNRLGKGKVYVVTIPVERAAAMEPHIVYNEPKLESFYAAAQLTSPEKAATQCDRLICMTEHTVDSDHHTLVIINPNAEARQVMVLLKYRWSYDVTLSPGAPAVRRQTNGFTVTLPADGAIVVAIARE